MLSDAYFNELLTHNIKAVLALLEDNPPALPAHLFCLYTAPNIPVGEFGAQIYRFNEIPQDKRGLMSEVAVKFFAEHNEAHLLAAYFITEAWVTSDPNAPSPSQAKDRREVISISGMTENSRCNAAAIEMGRNAEGGIVLGDIRRHPYQPTNSEGLVHHHLLTHFWTVYRKAHVMLAKALEFKQSSAGQPAPTKTSRLH